MKIRVNKNQWLDDYVAGNWRHRDYDSSTPIYNTGEFKVEDVTPEQLMEYINKGYGIRINC